MLVASRTNGGSSRSLSSKIRRHASSIHDLQPGTASWRSAESERSCTTRQCTRASRGCGRTQGPNTSRIRSRQSRRLDDEVGPPIGDWRHLPEARPVEAKPGEPSEQEAASVSVLHRIGVPWIVALGSLLGSSRVCTERQREQQRFQVVETTVGCVVLGVPVEKGLSSQEHDIVHGLGGERHRGPVEKNSGLHHADKGGERTSCANSFAILIYPNPKGYFAREMVKDDENCLGHLSVTMKWPLPSEVVTMALCLRAGSWCCVFHMVRDQKANKGHNAIF